MKNQIDLHQLLILSTEYDVYKQIFAEAELSNLSIFASDDPVQAMKSGILCDVIFGEPSLVCQVINHLPCVKWFQSSWAGVEPMFDPGLRTDYVLSNARNVYGEMMSEYVFGYMVAIERRILLRWQSQLKGVWDDTTAGTLKGKRIGLMGVGSIGSHLAATAHHFNMHVLGYTQMSETCRDVDQYFHGVEIFDFVDDLDYLVCSLPGTKATKGLLNDKVISALPRKAWLINVGRGNILDETALVKALHAGSLAGAVLDVFIEEPLPVGHPLWHTPNTYITSHTAAKNYIPDIAALFIENYKLFINGMPIMHQVNFEQQY
jgi:phosphoglycerate dehydrogenase-like enzyme